MKAAETAVSALEYWRESIVPHGHGQKRSTDRLRSRQLLHNLIHQHFDAGDVRQLCYDLGIVYDDLGDGGHDDRVRELILRVIRDDHMGRLLRRLRELRPGVDWPDVE